MNELASLGLILLLALMAGHLVKFLRIPEVTGYILAGIALGPSVLGWVSHENVRTLGVFSEVTLGLILFSVGSVLDYQRFRSVGRRIVTLTLIESGCAAALVVGLMAAFGLPWQAALLLGAIAMETAVASTLMVIRELDPSGPLTDTLMGIMAINNVLALVAFNVVATLLELTAGPRTGGFLEAAYTGGFTLVWKIAGSVALGYLCGLLLAGWSRQVMEHGEMVILMAGTVLLCVGAANWLELSPLLASLSIGATMANLSERSRHFFSSLSQMDPPLYAIFFVLAGADMELARVPSIGWAGLAYLVARAGGKFLGARVGGWRLGMDRGVQRYLGFTLLTQAGLAIGLTFVVRERFPEFAGQVATIVLSSIVIYEMIGPLLTKFALVRSGEAGMRITEEQAQTTT